VIFSRRDLRPFGSLFFSTASSDFSSLSFLFSGFALVGVALGGAEGEADGAAAGADAGAAAGPAAGDGWAVGTGRGRGAA
jgi:hypothetical protein